jgi:hypothetical protein
VAPTSSASAKPKAGSGDPCKVLPIATLEKISDLTGLSPGQFLGKTKNGCRWAASDPRYSIAYDVLPVRGSADTMMAAMQASATQNGGAPFTGVDLGNGHKGLSGGLADSSTGVASGTTALFLSDRYALITVILPTGSDAPSIAISLGKAFSAVADSLPAAPAL